MKREIETKFNIPETLDEKELLDNLTHIITTSGLVITQTKNSTRDFVYYDTSQFDFHKNEMTLRRVSGFDVTKREAIYRYDFKRGSNSERYELSIWDDRELTPEQIIALFHLTTQYSQVSEIARANTTHQYIVIEKDKTKIELVLDSFVLHNGKSFREMELELKSGDEKVLNSLSQHISSQLHLPHNTQQKYSRIVGLLR